MTNDELERPAMSDLVRFDVGISGGLITSAEGKWVSYASHCASRDALVNVVDAQADEIERLRQRLVEAEALEQTLLDRIRAVSVASAAITLHPDGRAYFDSGAATKHFRGALAALLEVLDEVLRHG